MTNFQKDYPFATGFQKKETQDLSSDILGGIAVVGAIYVLLAIINIL